jgi:hypothetical protein
VFARHIEHELTGGVTADPHRGDPGSDLGPVLDQPDPLLSRGAAQQFDPVRVCVGGELGALRDGIGRPELQLHAGHGHARVREQVEVATLGLEATVQDDRGANPAHAVARGSRSSSSD